MDESHYVLSPHLVLPLGQERVAILSRENRGWAVLPIPDYGRLLGFFDATPAEFSKRQTCSPANFNTLERLHKAGLVFKNGEVFSRVKEIDNSGPSLLIKMTGSCNYACTYCYDFSDERWRQRLRPEKILEMISELMTQYGRLSVIFHGGEPLIEYKGIREIVQTCNDLYGRGTVSYRMQTNGSLLDTEKVAFLEEHGFVVGISIDGNSSKTDALRPPRFKKATASSVFERIVREHSEFITKRCGVLSVIGRHNIEEIPDFVLWLQDIGVSGVSFSFLDPVGKEKTDSDNVVSPGEAVRLYGKLLDMIEDGRVSSIKVSGVIVYLDTLANFHTPHICYKGPCGAGDEFFVLDSNGGRRSCDCVIDDFFLADTANASNEQAMKAARGRIEYRHAWLREQGPCATCSLVNLCGGTCVAKAIGSNGTANSVYAIECALSKFMFPRLLNSYANDPTGPIFGYHRKHSALSGGGPD
jgi:uncharacterized protein